MSKLSQTDPMRQIDEVDRTLASSVREDRPTKVITISQSYPIPIADLWDACTQGERISRWLLPITGDLREGGRYQLEGNAGGTIERCVPRERIAATWEYGDEVSWVVATFSGGDDESTIHIEHTAHVDDERWQQFGPGAVGIGWDGMLLGLAMHIVSGVARPAEEGVAWMATDEGKAFMTASGEAWRDTQIAAGEDETLARESSARCIAAYTG